MYTEAIRYDRLSDIIKAEKEGRVLIMPSRNDEIIHSIEVGLGFKLHDWQKAYIFGLTEYKMPGRAGGRTTAHILKVLLSEGEPIRMYERRISELICDEYHGQQYYEWYRRTMREIYQCLSNPQLDLKLRKVYFAKDEIPRYVQSHISYCSPLSGI